LTKPIEALTILFTIISIKILKYIIFVINNFTSFLKIAFKILILGIFNIKWDLILNINKKF